MSAATAFTERLAKTEKEIQKATANLEATKKSKIWMVRPPGFEPGHLLALVKGDQKRGRLTSADISAVPVLDQARLRPQREYQKN